MANIYKICFYKIRRGCISPWLKILVGVPILGPILVIYINDVVDGRKSNIRFDADEIAYLE